MLKMLLQARIFTMEGMAEKREPRVSKGTVPSSS